MALSLAPNPGRTNTALFWPTSVMLRDASLVIHRGSANTSAAALSSSALKLEGGTERKGEFDMDILQRIRLIQGGFHNAVCVHRQQVLFH
ncbi:MAG TPA: hypothetical protein DEP13_00715, partial [Gammaproteobacteria bacterium]|nr:hypothetical protein [Gammaproteobacteria bacterium]